MSCVRARAPVCPRKANQKSDRIASVRSRRKGRRHSRTYFIPYANACIIRRFQLGRADAAPRGHIISRHLSACSYRPCTYPQREREREGERKWERGAAARHPQTRPPLRARLARPSSSVLERVVLWLAALIVSASPQQLGPLYRSSI